MIWVNSENVRHLPTPFGGMKDRPASAATAATTRSTSTWRPSNIALALGNHAIPRLGAV